MAGAIFLILGVLAGLVVLCTIIVCVVCHCQGGTGNAKDGGGGGGGSGGGVSSAIGRQEALLNKNKDDVAVTVAVAAPHQPGGVGTGGQRGQEPSDGDVDLCAICKARLTDASWGRCRRLRPCGHVYHADCISLWLQRRRICPVCRSAVAMSRIEILDAIV